MERGEASRSPLDRAPMFHVNRCWVRGVAAVGMVDFG